MVAIVGAMTFSLSLRPAAILISLALLTNCASPPPPAPPPPVIRPAPAPPPPPRAADWRDWPVAAGNWFYHAVVGGSIAQFRQAGQEALLTLRCEATTRRIIITRATTTPASAGPMAVRTSYGAVSWPIEVYIDPAVPASANASAVRAATDPTWDQIAFSRGRFAIEAPGAEPLVVPASAEVGRVIEDCRG